MKTLVLGMGNTLLCDDGIGIIVKRYLEQKLYAEKDTDFVETSWGGFRIVDLIRGYDYAVIIDSIKTLQKPEGYIHHLKPSALLPTLRLTSYHDINFITALKLAESLHAKIPDDIDIFAIEIENNYTIIEQISEKLWKSVTACADEIKNLLLSKKIISDDFRACSFVCNLESSEIQSLFGEQYFVENKALYPNTKTI